MTTTNAQTTRQIAIENNTDTPSSVAQTPLTGTWFGRWGNAPYEVTSGIDYRQALNLATAWATRHLDDTEAVEIEVDVIPAGDEWIVDVVAYEVDPTVTQIGSRQARIDSSGRLVA